MEETSYLSEQTIAPEQIQDWVETFHRDGCLFLENVLTPAHCTELRNDLELGTGKQSEWIKQWQLPINHASKPSHV